MALSRNHPYRDLLATVVADTPPVPIDYFTAMIYVESNFDSNARSASDARGLGQLIPRWHATGVGTTVARQLDKQLTDALWYDAEFSLRCAALHLRWCFTSDGSQNWERAIRKYHSGSADPPSGFVDGQGTSSDAHITKVRAALAEFHGAASPTAEGTPTMTTIEAAAKAGKIIIDYGHRNSSRGGANREFDWTPKGGAAIERALEAAFADVGVSVVQRDDGGTDPTMIGGNLDAVGDRIVRLDRERGPFFLCLFVHYDGTSNAPGHHTIPPSANGLRHYRDGSRDLDDTWENNGLDVWFAEEVARQVKQHCLDLGLRRVGGYPAGVMPEFVSGVGSNGWRIAFLGGTHAIRGHCVRAVLECGSIAASSNGAWMWDDGNLRRWANAIAAAAVSLRNRKAPAPVPDQPAPEPAPVQMYATPYIPANIDKYLIKPGENAPELGSDVLSDGTAVFIVNDIVEVTAERVVPQRGSAEGEPAVGKTYVRGDHLLAVFRFVSKADGKEWVYVNSLNPDDPMRGGRIPASTVKVVSDRPDGAV